LAGSKDAISLGMLLVIRSEPGRLRVACTGMTCTPKQAVADGVSQCPATCHLPQSLVLSLQRSWCCELAEHSSKCMMPLSPLLPPPPLLPPAATVATAVSATTAAACCHCCH
jgi:hypothetical protein